MLHGSHSDFPGPSIKECRASGKMSSRWFQTGFCGHRAHRHRIAEIAWRYWRWRRDSNSRARCCGPA